jgi:hypothetical protein
LTRTNIKSGRKNKKQRRSKYIGKAEAKRYESEADASVVGSERGSSSSENNSAPTTPHLETNSSLSGWNSEMFEVTRLQFEPSINTTAHVELTIQLANEHGHIELINMLAETSTDNCNKKNQKRKSNEMDLYKDYGLFGERGDPVHTLTKRLRR